MTTTSRVLTKAGIYGGVPCFTSFIFFAPILSTDGGLEDQALLLYELLVCLLFPEVVEHVVVAVVKLRCFVNLKLDNILSLLI